MNRERIDELAEQTGCTRHLYWDPNHPDLEGWIIGRGVLDKFAESIVREVLTGLENRLSVYNDPGSFEPEQYYVRMRAKADAIEDAISMIKHNLEIN